MLIKKLFLSFSVLILFASVISCASETSTEPKEEVISIAISTNSIAINPNSVTKVGKGETLQLTVTIATMEGVSEDVEWSSADESIATVDTNGLVTGVATGTVTITVTSIADSSKSASVEISVVEEVISIAISTNSIAINPNSVTKVIRGEKLQLGVNIETKGASEDVEWSSANENIATVDTNGLVTGVAAGTVMIMVTSTADNSKTASVSIEVVPPPAGEVWTQVIPSGGHFSVRGGHQAFLGNDNRLWVIGGTTDGNNRLNDIWYSDNEGVSWTQVTPSGGHFSGRNGHQSFLGENGRLWVIGGYDGSYKNDIWYSDDQGVSWTQVSATGHFSARSGHQAFLGKDGKRLWVMGGDDGDWKNDIWYSDNEGVSWTQVIPSSSHFSARNYHQSFLGEDGRLWVIGGDNIASRFNDIWYSDDQGVSWTQVTPSGGHFSGRSRHQAFLGEGGRLWVMGGITDSTTSLNDIWYSDNEGVNWTQVIPSSSHFSARFGHQAFLGEDGRLWVIAGVIFNYFNDIWYSD